MELDSTQYYWLCVIFCLTLLVLGGWYGFKWGYAMGHEEGEIKGFKRGQNPWNRIDERDV
jgi:hypothetical protein